MKSLSIQNCQAFNLNVTGLGIRFRESCQSGATATEKKRKKKITTTKSLILAQDER
jgi:hypothetical protein